jgi:hypothetical protein
VPKGTFNIRDFETPRKKNFPAPVLKNQRPNHLKVLFSFFRPWTPKEPSKETYAPRPFRKRVFL